MIMSDVVMVEREPYSKLAGQPLFHAEQLEKSLFLTFEVKSNIMIFSLKPLSVQQFVNNFYLGAPISAYDHMRSQPQFHAAM